MEVQSAQTYGQKGSISYMDRLRQLNRRATFAVWLSVLGYAVYTQPDLKHLYFFFFCGRFLDLLLLPLITLRESGNHVTSVEYNVQSRAILGIISYAAALWYIALPTNPLGSYVNGRTKEFVALAFACGFKSVDLVFEHTYCHPFNGKLVWDVIEDNISTPLSLLLMTLVQYGEIEQRFTAMIGAFFLYKMLRLASEYQVASEAKTETKPRPTLLNSKPEKKEGKLVTPLAQQNRWLIYGNEYDMTEYVAHHPGGKESIMLGANREDCTALFQSYHAFNLQKAKAVLEKYRVSDVAPGTKPDALTSSKHENDPFYDVLSQRVAKALRDANIDPVSDRAATWFRWAFYAVILLWTLGSFILHCRGSLLGSLSFGIAGSFVAGHIGHDGGHFAVSRIPFINDLALWGMSCISNPICWQHQHTYAHHSYTNENERDPDLHHFRSAFRVQKDEKFHPHYKNQSSHIYTLSIFAFAARGLNYTLPLRCLLERSLHGAVDWADQKRILRTAGLLFHFATYSTIMTIVPYFVHESWWKAFLSTLLAMGSSGAYFGLVSQVGHINEAALGRDPDVARQKRHEIARNSWAADQIETTNDFCPQSSLAFIFAAALGYQIEHHLFPTLNHCHLHIIQPVVEKTAKEYNVDYKSYRTFGIALNEYLIYVTSLSKEV